MPTRLFRKRQDGPGVRPNARRLTRLVTAAVLTSTGLFVPAVMSFADSVTVSVDNMRTGWDKNEAGLAPSAVSASDFGQLFSTTVNGQVYAQPIVGGGNLIVATENNYVYGMNPVTGAVNWSRSVGPAWPAATVSCGDLVPNIGITSTPVFDPASGTAYFTAKVNDGPDANSPHWYLHAIDAKTGAERTGWPMTIAGTPTNSPGHPFNPKTAAQRPGLLLMNGVIYIGFASHCDHGPYVGYVVGVNASTAKQTAMWSTEAGSSNAEAGIWQSGGGLVSDGAGRIFLATGNGVSPVPGPGTTVQPHLAESLVRLQVQADGSLAAKDFFSPANNTKLDTNDTDFGSGGPLALPDGYGSTAHPHLIIQMGKDGRMYLLDRDDLGGVAQGANGTDKVVSMAGPYAGLWGHPAFWGGSGGGYVYTVENGTYLRASKITKDAGGTPILAMAGTSTGTFGYTSGSPVVTSDGTTAGSALVWVIRSTGPAGGTGQIRAYDAVPVNGVMNLRYSASIGTASKFATPATDNGRVYVGTRDGTVLAFGRPAASVLTGSPVTFGSVAVGTTKTATLTVRATQNLTVTGASTTAPFGVTSPGSKALTTGQTLAIPVTFTPTAAGEATAAVTVTTSVGSVSFDLTGNGTKAGLAAAPTSIDFGTVPTGANRTLSISITNTGTTAATITSTTAPSAPYSVGSLPANGSSIPAGGSVAISVKFAPTSAGTKNSSLTISSSTGSVTVPITGVSVDGSANMTLDPNPLDFSAVLLGTSKTSAFAIGNSGNVNLTITKAKTPAGAFYTDAPVAEGQIIEPGESIDQPITFRPAATGQALSDYIITGDDTQGAQDVGLVGVGAKVDNFVNLAASRCMDVANSAVADGTLIQLYDCNGTSAQNWRFGANSSIRALGKCLDVKYSKTADDTTVWLYTCNGTGAQQWTVTAKGELKNTRSGKCLTPLQSGLGDGTPLVIFSCSASLDQTWLSASRTGPVVGSTSARCLDVANASPANGTAVQLFDCNGTGAQIWNIARGGTVQALGKCLDVTKGAKTNGTPVQLWDCNGGVAQQWTLTAGGALQNPNSGRCLAAAGNGIENYTRMQIQDCTGTANQVWALN